MALKLLGSTAKDASEALAEAAKDKDESVRELAAAALKRIKGGTAASPAD
jgi:HEAT repeat protein